MLFFQKLHSFSHLDTHLKPHYIAEGSEEAPRVHVCVCVCVTDAGQEKENKIQPSVISLVGTKGQIRTVSWKTSERI